MSRYWSGLTASLVPYVPGEQPQDKTYIKLNTNENPYPPSPRVVEAIRQAAGAELRLYPDPDCGALRSKLAEYCGLDKEQIFVGNGSDEVLAFAFPAFFSAERPILFPDITYSFYPVYAKLYGIPYETVPTDERFAIDPAAYAIPNGGIVLPNPNAPTTLAAPAERIRSILEANPDSVVVIDEAYVDFGAESVVPLVRSHPNLLVVQTLSKSRSLAGLRVGAAMGHPDLIEGLNRVKNSFNSYTLDRLALAGAAAAIEDDAYFRETTGKVIATRERTAAELRTLGFDVADSKANFLFVAHPGQDAKVLFAGLKEKGILVRYFDKPRIDRHLRVSIGTDEEMDAFIAAIRALVARE
ncbi:histidinol-phosphate transaminase [Paenibacillaceae bacterium WGS1546]|uniref:histidinol-phosphate transaminase n=1 Tax=Cohnella sp. WGS1546 TaxID=3366810 RepID=UPI00372D4A9C